MIAILHALGMFVTDLFKSRSWLEAENLLLCYRLNIALRRKPLRPRLCGVDQAPLVRVARCHGRLIDVEALPRLQARISSLQELRDLIRALRSLAASHVQEAQAALPGIRRYVEVVEGAIAKGAALLPKASTLTVSADQALDASALIVVCSEHGFAGAFNEMLLDRAEAERNASQQLVVIGRRGAVLAEVKGVKITSSFPMATHIGGVLGVTRRVAERLSAFSTADIVFGGYRRGGNFEPESKRVLPLDPALLVRSGRQSPPLHHLEPAMLLERLASEYLFGEITRAVMESLASENGARLPVMGTADQNIGDKLEDLRRREHSLRQEGITSELLDVVTGSEAILGDVRR